MFAFIVALSLSSPSEVPAPPAASAAQADAPQGDAALAAQVTAAVEKQLLAPVRDREQKRSRFSRAGPVPRERRVRVLDRAPVKDAQGNDVVRFAVDQRIGYGGDDAPWDDAAYVGCVVIGARAKDRAVFVTWDDVVQPAREVAGLAAGKAPPKGTCQVHPSIPTTT